MVWRREQGEDVTMLEVTNERNTWVGWDDGVMNKSNDTCNGVWYASSKRSNKGSEKLQHMYTYVH